MHTEIDWLRRGPKARTTKSKARIDKAHELIGELGELKERTKSTSAQIDFSASNRQTKQLITLDGVTYGIGDRTLFKDVHFLMTSGMRVGLVGPNGSGKTTLLRLLKGELLPDQGTIRKAESLRIVYFDQNRELDPDVTLAPGAGSRQRLGDLSGSGDSRRGLGSAILVRWRDAESESRKAFWG